MAARTLDDGVAWCEAALGVTPAPGGKHALMGTHNRLLAIGSAAFARAYLEIIAIDADAPAPPRRRWYELDAPALQRACAEAPQLVHWVARCDDIDARCARWRRDGVERGEVIDVERATASGPLRWRISVRDDGARLGDGAVPTLIQWAGRHPCDSLPASGVQLERLDIAGVPASLASDCTHAGVALVDHGAPLTATLTTPRGHVVLRAPPLGDPHVQP